MTNPSALWQVQIQGRASDLDHLVRHLNSADQRVLRDERDGGFLYTSAHFDVRADSEAVRAIAEAHLAVLSGVLRVTRNSEEPLAVGAVTRVHTDGRREVFVTLKGAQLRVEAGDLSVRVIDAAGRDVTQPQPPPRTVALAALAMRDNAVAKAMRLVAAENFRSWVRLYRVHEVIEADVGGEDALKRKAWGSLRDNKRFKHSANSVSVAGDDARHGREAGAPPKHPMSLDEAAAYVGYVVQAWLASKGG